MPRHSRARLRADLWLDRWLPRLERAMGWAVAAWIAVGMVALGAWASGA